MSFLKKLFGPSKKTLPFMGLEGNLGDGEETRCDNAPIQCDNRNAKWARKKIPRGISRLESPTIGIEP